MISDIARRMLELDRQLDLNRRAQAETYKRMLHEQDQLRALVIARENIEREMIRCVTRGTLPR